MKHMYYFSITIEGFTSDRKSVNALKHNLDSEIRMENTRVCYPIFREVPEKKDDN